MPISTRIKNHLEQRHIPYLPVAHPSSYTAQGAAAVMHVSGREVAKTVVVQAGNEYFLAVTPASYHVNVDKLAGAIGHPTRLATEGEFSSLFPDCEIGAIPPLGELYGLRVFVDESRATDREIIFNAGARTETRFASPTKTSSAWPSHPCARLPRKAKRHRCLWGIAIARC